MMMRCNFSTIRRGPSVRTAGLSEHQWLIPELAATLRVGHQTVYGWIRKHRVEAKQLDDGRWVVTANPEKCRELTAFQKHQQSQRARHESTSQIAKL